MNIPPFDAFPFRDLDHLGPVELAKQVQRIAREFTFLRSVFQALKEGVLVISEEGIVTYANQAACVLLGMDPEVMGHHTIRRISPEFAKGLHDLEGEERDNIWFRQEIPISYPQEKILKVCSGFFTPKDDLLYKPYWVVIMEDITQDKAQAEAMFEQEQLQSLQLLAGSIAHEIGNPLNSLMLHLQLLESHLSETQALPLQDQMQEGLHICKQEVTRLDGIVKHFLKAIRPIIPELQEIDLLDILKEVLLVQKTEMESLGISVNVSVGQALPMIKADPNLLKQVIFNVLKNSMEAMDRGGEIDIDANLSESEIILTIKDAGMGMDAISLSRIFQPFYTTKKDGNGLGMVMVERIIKAHGGKVQIQSALQQGTKMTIHLPHHQRRLHLLE